MNWLITPFSHKGLFINAKAFIYITILFSIIRADWIDTTIVADGGPGPYCIGQSFVDTATLYVKLPDSIVIPPWIYESENNALLFAHPIDSGTPIQIQFKTDYYGISKVYSLYPKRFFDPRDTLLLKDSVIEGFRFSDNEKLNITGYKSVGVSMGSFGQVNLEQGLNVRIGGEIRPGTKVNAHLSDQGTSLEGATREISEFDMVYIALTNPMYSAIVGDQYIEWPFEGILTGQKKIKGISGTMHRSRYAVGAFGALSGGTYTVETRRGENGVQGPYYLEGNGEQGFITPISGTVRITVNGSRLEEGENRDFVVDYDLGAVTFTPKQLIIDDDLIRIEYEYKTFDYLRSLLGSTAGMYSPDSSISIEGVLWSESDNKQHPIEMPLTPQMRRSLSLSGDNPGYHIKAQPVHPNDVPERDKYYPLYKKKYDPLYRDTIFVHTRYNPNNPDSVNGFFNIWFRKVNDGEKGDYNPIKSADSTVYRDTVHTDSVIHRDIVYHFVGKGNGQYTPEVPLSAPQRWTSGELKTAIDFPLISGTANIVGQERDKNLFSKRDDNDNLASATELSLLAGDKRTDKRTIWLAFDHRFRSQRFDGEIISAYEQEQMWDDMEGVTSGTEQQQWETKLGGTIVPGMTSAMLYGQDRRNNKLATQKIGNETELTFGNPLALRYNGTYFLHYHPFQYYGRRENARLTHTLGKLRSSLIGNEEWQHDTSGTGAGRIGGGIEFELSEPHLTQSVVYTRFREGEGWFGDNDTGFAVLWEQTFDHRFSSSWEAGLTSHYYHTVHDSSDKSTTLLITATNSIAPQSSGFSSRQEYRTNYEKASVFTQIPVFAGKGLGTHVYDSASQEYVPRTPGDFFLRQQEVYNNKSSQRVRKSSFDATWSYHPPQPVPGILNDLYWRGTLLLDEHIDADINGFGSWVPGYLSLLNHWKEPAPNDSSLQFADMSYRQDIEWRPDEELDGYTGTVFVLPAFRQIRGYEESSIESGFTFERAIHKWTFGFTTGGLMLFHDGKTAQDNFLLRDIHSELIQKYELIEDLFAYTKEGIGLARKQPQDDPFFPLSTDSTMYYYLTPGISWHPFDKGWADASYTYSVVQIPGDMDYRMAEGFLSGESHIFNISVDVKAGNHFMVGGWYRGQINKPFGDKKFLPGLHTVALQVKAFL